MTSMMADEVPLGSWVLLRQSSMLDKPLVRRYRFSHKRSFSFQLKAVSLTVKVKLAEEAECEIAATAHTRATRTLAIRAVSHISATMPCASDSGTVPSLD